MTNYLASAALASAGISSSQPQAESAPKKSSPNKIINGANTLAPIFSALTAVNSNDHPGELKKLLGVIGQVSKTTLKKALAAEYEIKPQHYVAVNRVAITLVCESYAKGIDIDVEETSNFMVETLSIQDIHADALNDELTDDDFALQFIGTANLSAVVVKHLAITRSATKLDEDDVIEIVDNIIEMVDDKFDEIFEEYIPEEQSLLIRKTLLDQAATILDGVILGIQRQQPDQTTPIKIPLLIKKFENAFEIFIEGLTPFIEAKNT